MDSVNLDGGRAGSGRLIPELSWRFFTDGRHAPLARGAYPTVCLHLP
jgi:hypothetical protein